MKESVRQDRILGFVQHGIRNHWKILKKKCNAIQGFKTVLNKKWIVMERRGWARWTLEEITAIVKVRDGDG